MPCRGLPVESIHELRPWEELRLWKLQVTMVGPSFSDNPRDHEALEVAMCWKLYSLAVDHVGWKLHALYWVPGCWLSLVGVKGRSGWRGVI